MDIRVLPEGAPQDVTLTVADPDILRIENIEGGGISLTALTAGNTLVTVSCTGLPSVAATVPVTVPDPLNLFPDIASFTRNGVTVTNNGDGTLAISGTATTGVGEYLDFELDAGRYRTEGCLGSWNLFIRFRNPAGQWLVQGNGTFTLAERTAITMQLLVSQGYPGTRPVTLTPRLTRIGDDDPDSEDTIP